MILFLILFTGGSAYAASVGTITLSGNVPAAVALVVPGSTLNLDLSTTAVDLPVGSVREISNVRTGYIVTLSSANAGLLKSTPIDSMPYSLKYNSVPVTLSISPVTVTSVASSVSVINILKSLSISYTGLPHQERMEGTYSDIITLSIQSQ